MTNLKNFSPWMRFLPINFDLTFASDQFRYSATTFSSRGHHCRSKIKVHLIYFWISVPLCKTVRGVSNASHWSRSVIVPKTVVDVFTHSRLQLATLPNCTPYRQGLVLLQKLTSLIVPVSQYIDTFRIHW